jgi:fructosamine-3-kinase
MIYETTSLSRELASAILRYWLGKPVNCESVERLYGGMIRSVLALEFDQPPYRAVIKVSDEEANPFEGEARALRYLRSHSRLPVPEVYLCQAAGELMVPGFLLMERLPGIHLGQAAMTRPERQEIDRQLADILLELHSHERDTFGPVDGSESFLRWLDYFEPLIRENFEDSRLRLTRRSQEIIPKLLDPMPQYFDSQERPTLIHGDIWETNVIVDRRGDRWVVTGLVDPAARYADVEFELAYLEVFRTVADAFFERYCRERPLREGYEVRRLYYWLNTLLLHVWIFGEEHYVARTERIAEELARRI